MRLHRVALGNEMDGHRGYKWVGIAKEAADCARRFREQDEGNTAFIELAEVPTEKRQLIRFLNQHAGHPDNGQRGSEAPNLPGRSSKSVA